MTRRAIGRSLRRHRGAGLLLLLALGAGAALPLSAQDTPPAAPASLEGEWLAEDIGGGGVLDRLQTTLLLAPDGSVSGFGGCNRYRGTVRLEAGRIRFGPLAATRMACTPAAMEQEHRFLAALEKATGFRLDAPRRKLVLLDDAGTPLVTLAAR